MRSLLAVLFLSSVVVAQEESCVKIINVNGSASGTVIAVNGDTSYILTNRHVAPDANKRCWIIRNGQLTDTTFIKAHAELDVALLSVKAKLKAATLAESDAGEGDEVKHYGSATGPQKGKATGVVTFVGGVKVSSGSYFNVPGDSGSGLFNAKGQLVGVFYARLGPPEMPYAANNYPIAVRLSDVKEFVKELVK